MIASKGVNVTEIEKQIQTTAALIAIIEEKIEELPLTKDALIIQYQREKELQRERNANKDYVKERELENNTLFKRLNVANIICKSAHDNIEIKNYSIDLGQNNKFGFGR